VAPIPVQRVPPLGRVQVRVSAEVLRAGQFTVEAAVRTPDGGALGEPTRLQVRSTVYGTVTVWLTAVAGGLLVLLAARRIWRRVRGDRAGSGPEGRAGGGSVAAVPPSPVVHGPTGLSAPPNGPSAHVRPQSEPVATSAAPAESPVPGPQVSRRGMSSADGDLS
jgi:hypothetical protein